MFFLSRLLARGKNESYAFLRKSKLNTRSSIGDAQKKAYFIPMPNRSTAKNG